MSASRQHTAIAMTITCTSLYAGLVPSCLSFQPENKSEVKFNRQDWNEPRVPDVRNHMRT